MRVHSSGVDNNARKLWKVGPVPRALLPPSSEDKELEPPSTDWRPEPRETTELSVDSVADAGRTMADAMYVGEMMRKIRNPNSPQAEII